MKICGSPLLVIRGTAGRQGRSRSAKSRSLESSPTIPTAMMPTAAIPKYVLALRADTEHVVP